MTMQRPWYDRYDPDVIRELLETRPEFTALVPSDHPAQASVRAGGGHKYSIFDPTFPRGTYGPGAPALTPTPVVTGPVAPLTPGSSIGGQPTLAPNLPRMGTRGVQPAGVASGPMNTYSGPAAGYAPVSPGAPPLPNTPVARGNWGTSLTAGLPAGMENAPLGIWWQEDHPNEVEPPGYRHPTWQELNERNLSQGKPGVPRSVTDVITGARPVTKFLGTNLPRYSDQARNRLLPSERELLNATITATGGRPEDFWAQSSRLSGAPRTAGYSISGAPRVGRR